MSGRFDLQPFVQECREALAEKPAQRCVREVLARAMADPSGVMAALGEPRRAGIDKLHHSDDLTILNVVWGPYMTVMPHDHRMWAVIGVYTGREDNIFWRRVEGDERKIEAAGAQDLGVGDAAPLGKNIVHSVTNPLGKLTGAIHIYGGDFFQTPRSEWDAETLREAPYDVERVLRIFEESNERYATQGA